ncbi:MAG: GIY-YIG nuclease family protein [Atopobiaceae bacterium]|jgi:putative endonuclease|nr:GIY-YIG nuclease family protein [Atopobiaceae bacterium]MCI2173976.1 GIY-YIG nuclease family protein [Atopobiaceae bacterium]MCI2207934.1 GIY-YIG nuclease family protein [Atopobiaceae bacterium]
MSADTPEQDRSTTTKSDGVGGYFVYVIRCEGGELYCGITTDVARRMREHASRKAPGAKYTRTHGVVALEALWSAPDRASASALEYRIKRLPRKRKLSLVSDPSGFWRLWPADSSVAASIAVVEGVTLDDCLADADGGRDGRGQAG